MKRFIATMIILISILNVVGQEKILKELNGKVNDKYGNPVIGATICLVGTTTGTISNIDGVFKLLIPFEDIILEVRIDKKTVLFEKVPKEKSNVEISAELTSEKYFCSSEIMSFGAEFLTGEISNTLNKGERYNFIDLGITTFKHPSWIFGISLMDYSIHKYNTTPKERKEIMNFYTTSDGSIEEINISIWRPGLFTEFQPFIKLKQKLSPFLRVTLAGNRLSSNLPKKGYVERETKWGAGVNFKGGMDYRLDEGMTIRIGYAYENLKDYELNLLPGLRQVRGGAYHVLYIATGFNAFNKHNF